MITMNFRGMPELVSKLATLQQSVPRVIRKSIGATGRIIKARILKLMKLQGGQYGVPQFDPWALLTWRIRMGAAKKGAGQMGGKLAQKYAIQMYARRGVITVGWISALEKWVDYFQTAESKDFTKGERRMFHKEGIHEIGPYSRPARPLIEPFAHHLQAKVPGWFVDVLNKELKRVGMAPINFVPVEPLPEAEGVA
jgi:hypothetical protein